MDTMQQLAEALADIHEGTGADVVYTTYDNGVLEFIIGWYTVGDPILYRHCFTVSEIRSSAPGLLTELLINQAKERKDVRKSAKSN